jgi:nucleoid-associated protein YgaU
MSTSTVNDSNDSWSGISGRSAFSTATPTGRPIATKAAGTVSSTASPTAYPSTRSASAAITPTAPAGGSYTVEPNDNYWIISEKVYGSGNYFKALEYHNRQHFPRGDLLRTGDVVSVPTVETLMTSYPKLCPKPSHVPPARSTTTLSSQRSGGKTYVVEEGDTLFDIARFELGKATRWAEIYQLNKELIGADFNHLRPGLVLQLPDAPSSDTFTRRPAAGIQR